jgi:hypothetical protein
MNALARNLLTRVLPGNGKDSGKLDWQSTVHAIIGWRDAPTRWQIMTVTGLCYLLVNCFTCGMSQPLDLVFYHQFPAL